VSDENKREDADRWIDEWVASMPEQKIELIDGKLVIGTLTGSRRILRELLLDYGPDLFLPMASEDLWWSALRTAYDPPSAPHDPVEWNAWADALTYEPEVAPAGPQATLQHRRLSNLLSWGLHYLTSASCAGESIGPDFVIQLGENGLTPDVMFIDRPGMQHMRSRYLEGPPTIVIEILQPASAEQDRVLKLRLYEEAGVPEYWLIDSERMECLFYRLGPDGRYDPVMIDPTQLAEIARSGKDYRYDSTAVPGLSLSMLNLWGMEQHDWNDPFKPFAPIERQSPPLGYGTGGIQWDQVPFAPRTALTPIPIRFEEFISWCGRAKFERWGGGLKIDGTESTRRIAGMLLMTFGLIETVRLAHPREWVRFLDRDRYRAEVQRHVAAFLEGATYKDCELGGDEECLLGEISIPNQGERLLGYGATPDECREDLMQQIEAWVLLRLVRNEVIPDPSGETVTPGQASASVPKVV